MGGEQAPRERGSASGTCARVSVSIHVHTSVPGFMQGRLRTRTQQCMAHFYPHLANPIPRPLVSCLCQNSAYMIQRVPALSLLIQWAPEWHLKRTCPASEANLKPLPLTRSNIPPRVQPPSRTPKASCVLDSDSTLTANPAGPKEGSGWPLHLPTWDRSHLEGRGGGLDSMKIKGMIRQPPELSGIFLMCVLIRRP